MINHFASQSQTCQVLKIDFLKHCIEIVKTVVISGWTDEDQHQIRSSNSLILQVQIITYRVSISL